LNSRIRLLIEDIRGQWSELDRRSPVAAFDTEFVAAARSDADARRLSTMRRAGSVNGRRSLRRSGKILWNAAWKSDPALGLISAE
jgi:hypothetical protein